YSLLNKLDRGAKILERADTVKLADIRLVDIISTAHVQRYRDGRIDFRGNRRIFWLERRRRHEFPAQDVSEIRKIFFRLPITVQVDWGPQIAHLGIEMEMPLTVDRRRCRLEVAAHEAAGPRQPARLGLG